MNLDRFKNFDAEVRDLVLRFECMKDSGAGRFFDVDQMEIIADYYLEVYDVDALEAAVEYGEHLFPGNNAMRLRRAHLWSIKGLYSQALAILQDLAAAEPDNTDVSYALGALYSMIDQPRKAIQYYLKAATDGYELAMIYGNIGDEYYKLGKIDESISYYKKSVKCSADEERSLFNLASTLEEHGRGEEAVDYLRQVVSDHPFSLGAWYALGSTYLWLGLYEKAIDAYEYVIVIDKTCFNAYLCKSDCYKNLNRYSEAISALREGMEYADDKAYVCYDIAQLFAAQSNFHAAVAYLQDALKEDPAYGAAWNELGLCCQRLGYIEEAADYYQRAIDVEPDHDGHWCALADLLMSQMRFAEAVSLLESHRAEATDDFDFDSRLLYCYFRQGRRNRMMELLRRIKDGEPELLGDLLYRYQELSVDDEVLQIVNEH